MEEELQKRNTDCVYFLASPLTCRKGAECEYRHSDVARLNPRDCWYWLSGNCLNPSCGFRHPPLEKAESATESDSSQVPAVAATNKPNVPCYFFFNGFCTKGDKCSFSHVPDTHPRKYINPNSANPSDKEAAMAPKKASIMPETAMKASADTFEGDKKDFHLKISQGAVEDAAMNSTPVIISGIQIQKRSYAPHQNPDDQAEQEERLESSPGFDVLVDDNSEYLAYEDDEGFRTVVERENMELNSHFLPDDYDPSEHYFEDGVESAGKRKSRPREDERSLDLRHHLSKRRTGDTPRRHGLSQRLRERLVEKELVAGNDDFPSNGDVQGGWANGRNHFKRQLLSEESAAFSGPKSLAQIKEEKKNATPSDFEGPKPLSEILKDKRKVSPL